MSLVVYSQSLSLEMRSMSVWRELWYRYDEQESCSMYLSRMEQMLIASNIAKLKAQREGIPEPRGLLTNSARTLVCPSHFPLPTRATVSRSRARVHSCHPLDPTSLFLFFLGFIFLSTLKHLPAHHRFYFISGGRRLSIQPNRVVNRF